MSPISLFVHNCSWAARAEHVPKRENANWFSRCFSNTFRKQTSLGSNCSLAAQAEKGFRRGGFRYNSDMCRGQVPQCQISAYNCCWPPRAAKCTETKKIDTICYCFCIPCHNWIFSHVIALGRPWLESITKGSISTQVDIDFGHLPKMIFLG